MYHPTIFTQTLNMDLESALAAMKRAPRGRPPKNVYNQDSSSNGLKHRPIRPRPTEELYDSWSPSREEQSQIQGAMDILAARNISVVPVMNPSPASRESSPPLSVTSSGPLPAKTPPEYEDADADPDPDPDMDFAPMFCEVIVGQSDAQGSQPDSELSITPRVVLGSPSRLDKCYRCDLCPRSYSSRAGLWYHKKAHSGDKQYSCYVCFKRFSQKSHLEVHIKYHRSRGQAPPWEPDPLEEKSEEGNRGLNSTRQTEEEEVGDAAAVGAEIELEVTRRSLSPSKGSSSFDNGRRGSPRSTPSQRGTDINFAQIFEGFKKDDDVAGGAAQQAIRHGSARFNDLIISAIPPSIPAPEPRALQSAQIQALLAKSPKLDKCYKCELCSNTYSSRAGLWYHRKTHSGNKQHTCKLCGQNFTQKGHLQAHMRTHEVEHPYACTHCEATFTDRASLESHMFTHTPGEKPFGCRHCGERFERQLQLIQHERTHAVNKPLKCPHCERSFAHKNNLVNHMRVHRSSADLAKIGL